MSGRASHQRTRAQENEDLSTGNYESRWNEPDGEKALSVSAGVSQVYASLKSLPEYNDLIKKPVFSKTIDFLKQFAKLQNQGQNEVIASFETAFDQSPLEIDPIEQSLLASLALTELDEAKALIPTLNRFDTDEENGHLMDLLDSINRVIKFAEQG